MVNPYQPPTHPHTPGYASGGGYEFGSSENEIIGSAGTWCTILGILAFVQAVWEIIDGVLKEQLLGGIVSAAIDVALGILLVGAGSAFRRVVQTQGNDVQHLLEAVQKLGTVFIVRIVLICLAFALVVIGALVMLLFLGSMVR